MSQFSSWPRLAGSTSWRVARRRARDKAQADGILATARDRADTVLDEARNAADERLVGELAPSQREVLQEERTDEDEAVQQERTVADTDLSRERAARQRALTALLALEREQTDQHLVLERDSADAAIRSRDEFLALVSHDLRDLLGGIALSAASLLTIDCEPPVRDEVSKGADRIKRYTARMSRLVGDLLDVVSIEAGRFALSPRREDASALLLETVEVYQPIAAANDISIRSEIKTGSLLARYDHERLLQVFANLIGNAIKFTPRGGRIDILVEPVEREVRFSISDTGPGIAPDQLEIIFERFWQVAKPPRTGVGLGLYISRCIVEAHGGKLWVESKLNEGSTFFFTLPAAAEGDSSVQNAIPALQ